MIELAPELTVRYEAVELLRRLVACDTSNPPGREAQAAAILQDYLGSAGIESQRVAKDPERPNLLARLCGRGDGPSLAFLGHLDVVQARREDWTVEPFAGIERDGAIWGRGTVDMKCQVAATAVALATLAREGFTPAGDLMLILMADEEVGDAGVGAPFFVEQKPDLRPDFVVGEGAGERYATRGGPIYLLDHGVKASASATLTARGRAADASLPGNGANAAYELARLLARLENREPRRHVHPAVEPLLDRAGDEDGALGLILQALTQNVMTPAVIDAPGPENVALEEAKATVYIASLPGVTKEHLEDELRSALGEGDYELEVDEPQGGSISELHTPLHAAIEGFVAKRDPGAQIVPALGYGFSDCHFLREAYGSVAYGFIPFRHAEPQTNLATKHAVDERVLVDDLMFQVDCAYHVARAISAPDGPAKSVSSTRLRALTRTARRA